MTRANGIVTITLTVINSRVLKEYFGDGLDLGEGIKPDWNSIISKCLLSHPKILEKPQLVIDINNYEKTLAEYKRMKALGMNISPHFLMKDKPRPPKAPKKPKQRGRKKKMEETQEIKEEIPIETPEEKQEREEREERERKEKEKQEGERRMKEAGITMKEKEEALDEIEEETSPFDEFEA
jgi:flagellar biosynthesis GTPase FlhF